MKIETIHPELQDTYRKVKSLPFHNKYFVKLINFLLKFAKKNKIYEGVDIREIHTDGIAMRMYRPTNSASFGAMLWIHGGGLLIGKPVMDDRLCVQFCRSLNIVVASVDYRLASKQPFPAAIEDCVKAWQWLSDNASDLGLNINRIVIAGLSAGGGLAASAAQKIFDLGGPQPAAQVLFCPMLDDRTAANHQLDAVNHKAWNNKNNRAGWSAYLGHPPGKAEVAPYAVPARRENLAGLPPCWIAVGDIDLFYQEDLAYHEGLQQSGVSSELLSLPGVPHGFESLAPDSSVTRSTVEACLNFLEPHLRGE